MSSEDKDNTDDHSQPTGPVMGKSGRPIFFYSSVRDAQKPKDGKDDTDAGIAEFYQFAALGAGAICFFYKMKVAAWLTILLFFSSVINFRFEHMT